MDLGLMEKIALVAGGSRGCGYAIAEELASEGAKVVLSGRQVEQVEAAERALRDRGFVATGIAADMTTEGGCDAMVDVARKTYGDPDILVVNSPGPFPDTRSNRGRGFDNCADDLYAEVHNNFVLSQVRLARAVLPSMKEKRWGRLVNLGSIAMKVPHLEDPMPAVNTRVAVAALMEESRPGVRSLRHYGQYHRYRTVRQRAFARIPRIRNRGEDRGLVSHDASGWPLGTA